MWKECKCSELTAENNAFCKRVTAKKIKYNSFFFLWLVKRASDNKSKHGNDLLLLAKRERESEREIWWYASVMGCCNALLLRLLLLCIYGCLKGTIKMSVCLYFVANRSCRRLRWDWAKKEKHFSHLILFFLHRQTYLWWFTMCPSAINANHTANWIQSAHCHLLAVSVAVAVVELPQSAGNL